MQARAGYWPKVDVAESWQRGNQPVFVFSSLLAQRQFTAADFALGALNHPDALDNFRLSVMVEQSLFDGGGPITQCEADVMQRASPVVMATRSDRPSWGITDSVAKVLGACQRPVLFIPAG
jgi:hypothetical protein